MRQLVFPLRLIAVLVLALSLAGPATTRVAAQDDTTPPVEEPGDSSPDEDAAATEGEQEAPPATPANDDGTPPDGNTSGSENPPAGEPDSGTTDPGEDGTGDSPPSEEAPPDTTANGTAGETPGDEPPAEEPPAQDPPGDESPPEESPTDEPAVEASPIEEPPVQATPDGTKDEGDLGSAPATTDDEVAATPDATPDTTEGDVEVSGVGGTEDVEITTRNSNGDELLGACYSLFGNDNGAFGNFRRFECDASDGSEDGVTTFEDFPIDDYFAFQSNPPSGFLREPSQAFSIDGVGETTTLTFVNDQAGAGTDVTIRKVDGNGNPVENACFAIFEDLDPAGGQVSQGAAIFTRICDGLAGADALNYDESPGNFVLVEIEAPPGFDFADPVEFTVGAQPAIVTMVDPARDFGGNGDLVVYSRDATSQTPINSNCFRVFTSVNGDRGTVVQDEVRDDNFNGSIFFYDLAPGDYILAQCSSQTSPPDYLPADDQPFAITANAVTELVILYEADEPRSSFVMTKEDEEGNPVEGACFEIYEDLDDDPGQVVFGELVVGGTGLCSQGNGGILSRFQDDGHYVAVEVVTPPGFVSIDAQEFEVDGPDTPVVLVNIEADENTPGKVIITKHTPGGDLLPGACFRVFENDNGDPGDPVSDETCDPEDGTNDGRITIGGLLEGDYLLVETEAPDGFNPVVDRVISIVRGQSLRLTIVDSPEDPNQQSSFIATKEDANGNPLEGACFEFYEDLDPDEGQVVFGELLTGGTGLCSDATGFILHRNQEDGHYIAVEVTTPAGFITIDAQEFEVDGFSSPVVLINEEASADTPGKVVITKQKLGSDPLPGACFRVFENDGGDAGDPVSDEVCDGDDGLNDTRITIGGLLEGSYVLVETDAPVGFLPVNDQVITIVRGQTLRLTIIDLPGEQESGFLATKVDENGDPIEGACFEFREDLDEDPGQVEIGDILTGGSSLCSDASGFILQRNQDAGTYLAVEVTTPDGFAPTITEFTVEAGEVTDVEIVNHLAGSLTVIKLFCEGDEDAVEFEVNGSDDDDCDRGDAEFQITAFGETDLDPFDTGDDGEITLTLPETDGDEPHVLTETATGASIDFDVAPGEETTIVVKNIEGVDDDDDEDDEDDEDDDPTTLPTTGVGGPAPVDNALAPFGLVSLLLLATAYLWQRRWRAG